jgi:GrpB-like predicted nucleotidyltransferase (UPF0157 family)
MSNVVRSDAELEANRIGPLEPLNSTIYLADYNSNWPRVFERDAGRIRDALGDRALVIEHAGSTSVPGLAAKPIIDIVLAVADTANESDYIPSMEAAGYILRIREPDWHQHRLFKGPEADINLHTFTIGCAEIDRMLRFRDHLRSDATDREHYLTAKRELAARTWRHTQHYADAKSDVVEQIVARSGATAIACERY